MPLRHRSIQPSGLFFVTTSTANRVARFTNGERYKLVLDNIEFYRKREKALIHGYVIMPNHLHLIISIPEGKSISTYMGNMKKRVAFEYYRLEGTDPFPFWEHRFDDVHIYSEDVYYTKLNYIHSNPVKAGFVAKHEEWPYSSAGFYAFNKQSLITVNPLEL
jgi:putative transposase